MTLLESSKKIHSTAQRPYKHSSAISSDSLTFEEVYKTSYSHGLEAIYALENIDIKSVRRIEIPSKSSSQKRNEKVKKDPLLPLQEELDLGEEFRGWIPSFVKKEPIQVLELSRHAEKSLIENGKSTLGDLIGVNLKNFVFLRGMGQGHIEEIQQRLNSYIEGKNLDRCFKVDFASWLKCVVAAYDRKKVYVLLESFDLSSLFSLTPGESVEVRKLTLEKKQEWIEELLLKMTQPQQKNALFFQMKQIFTQFFTPWIRQRGGLATKEELQERMQRISVQPSIGGQVVRFFESQFFENRSLFPQFLPHLDEEIFFSDLFQLQNYRSVVNQAMSYFYHPAVFYSLEQLISFLEKEFSRSWIGFPDGYIEKVLRHSFSFNVVKGSLEGLEIYRNSIDLNRLSESKWRS